MQVKDSMTKQVVCVGSQEPVEVAARLMAKYNLGMLPVKNASGRLVGVVTDRDLAIRALAGKTGKQVGDVMTRGAITAAPEDTVEQAATKMGSLQIRRLPVVQSGSLVGVISLGDLTRSGHPASSAGECLGKICDSVCRFHEMK